MTCGFLKLVSFAQSIFSRIVYLHCSIHQNIIPFYHQIISHMCPEEFINSTIDGYLHCSHLKTSRPNVAMDIQHFTYLLFIYVNMYGLGGFFF